VHPVYQWQVNGNDIGANQPTFTTASLMDGNVVTCNLMSTGKCLINPSVTSNAIMIALNPVNQCIVTIPNAFTPNGDGINDLWDVSALQAYPGCTIFIYNRYGALVYHSVNYPKAWDGTINGKKLASGTYYYIIDLKNGKKPLSGPVTILQ
jgi:gliding motility-associated-like protein